MDNISSPINDSSLCMNPYLSFSTTRDLRNTRLRITNSTPFMLSKIAYARRIFHEPMFEAEAHMDLVAFDIPDRCCVSALGSVLDTAECGDFRPGGSHKIADFDSLSVEDIAIGVSGEGSSHEASVNGFKFLRGAY